MIIFIPIRSSGPPCAPDSLPGPVLNLPGPVWGSTRAGFGMKPARVDSTRAGLVHKPARVAKTGPGGFADLIVRFDQICQHVIK